MSGYDEGYINSLTNAQLRAQCSANGIPIWYRDENRKQHAVKTAEMRVALLSLRGRVAPPGESGRMQKNKLENQVLLPDDVPINIFTQLLIPAAQVWHPRGRVFTNE
jgi:hypothetical protein